MSDTQVFSFEKAKKVREQQANFEAAKAQLKEVQKDFLSSGSLEAFTAQLKEVTGGKAKAFMYALVDGLDGSEYCSIIKGNEKVGNNGSLTATYGFWEEAVSINLSQIIKIYASEDEYNVRWSEEEAAYTEAEAEAERLAAAEIANKEAEKQRKKDERMAEKLAAKGLPLPEVDAAAEVVAGAPVLEEVVSEAPVLEEVVSEAPVSALDQELVDALKQADKAIPARSKPRAPTPSAPAPAAE